ncbi:MULTISPECIES: acyl-CoA thioesterase [Acetobacter]|uniref:Acyl-CoA thioesterase n=1 Tax=Acetobacter thailandicus TaxID=1502842 RepID=A0ABT3QC82_9PROT|nr:MULTISPECIES: acyl-CoA thioesterase [Acetobacter]MBS0961190.1 acyl-CoA thioesterase [Acetobacter thailandicus]MBS0981429.1 acyl-CoA thioesterase [Acetobacter thailandicus]MBS0986609.1 acyl-CoA thioesterase [Acetobacter thailandicus]MBS1003838.1 acyl-CoA thioesterase [Acetobacter thailandicus]MCX2562844.1 acyl-CoA thioesterase [Acetobacter thailandicus]
MPETSPALPAGIPTIRVVAMPSNTNPAGDIFGGWIVSQMDLAAGTVAAFRSNGRATTVAIDKLTFLEPVAVGDEVSIYTEITREGHTSLTIHVQTWRRARHTHKTSKVTEGDFTFVALDENRRPRPLPDMDKIDPSAGPVGIRKKD